MIGNGDENRHLFDYSDAGTGGGPGGPLAPRSVNPIPTGEGRLSPHITTGTPNVFHLPASLLNVVRIQDLFVEYCTVARGHSQTTFTRRAR